MDINKFLTEDGWLDFCLNEETEDDIWFQELNQQKSSMFPQKPRENQLHMNSDGTIFIYQRGHWDKVEEIRLF